jgi:hypothetical protein
VIQFYGFILSLSVEFAFKAEVAIKKEVHAVGEAESYELSGGNFTENKV